MRTHTLIVASACLLLLGAPALAVEYLLTDLGTFGGQMSWPEGINNQGQVVGHYVNAAGQQRAFLWQNGAMTDLGTLGGDYAGALGINELGQVVGSASVSGYLSRAFIYQNGTMRALGYGDTALWINDAGQVVGYYQGTDLRGYGFLWSNGTVTEMTALGVGSTASAINNHGVICGSIFPATGERGFIWKNGVMTILPTLWGASEVHTLNDNDVVVGWSTLISRYRHAVAWQNGQIRDLGTLGGHESFASAINNAGLIGGNSFLANDEVRHACIWRDGKTLDLNTLVNLPPGVSLTSVQGLNQLGWIVANGQAGSETHAFLLVPHAEPDADLNDDDVVDTVDEMLFRLVARGSCVPGPSDPDLAALFAKADLDRDGDVDQRDFGILQTQFGH